MPGTNTLKAHIALFVVALIYGGNYTIAKLVLDDGYLHPLTFILLRAFFAFIAFTFFQRIFVHERIERRDLWMALLCAVFGVAINQMFFFSGLKQTTPINASLIMTTSPILVLIASFFLIGEPVTPGKIAGISLGALGAILLITYGKDITYRKEQWVGDLLVFINATSYGIYLVLVKSLMRKYHPLTVTRWVFTFGVLLVFPFGVGGLSEAGWQVFPFGVWMAVAYVLIGTTFLAYLLNAYALKTVNPSIVGIYIYLQPFVAALIALLTGKDQLTTVKLISGLLIFAGVYLVSSKRKMVNSQKKRISQL